MQIAALAETGLPPTEAVRKAADAVMVIEGALLLSRALADTGPFQRVMRHLEETLSVPGSIPTLEIAEQRAVGTFR